MGLWLVMSATGGCLVDIHTRFYIERAICPGHQTWDALGKDPIAPQSWVRDIVPDESVLWHLGQQHKKEGI